MYSRGGGPTGVVGPTKENETRFGGAGAGKGALASRDASGRTFGTDVTNQTKNQKHADLHLPKGKGAPSAQSAASRRQDSAATRGKPRRLKAGPPLVRKQPHEHTEIEFCMFEKRDYDDEYFQRRLQGEVDALVSLAKLAHDPLVRPLSELYEPLSECLDVPPPPELSTAELGLGGDLTFEFDAPSLWAHEAV